MKPHLSHLLDEEGTEGEAERAGPSPLDRGGKVSQNPFAPRVPLAALLRSHTLYLHSAHAVSRAMESASPSPPCRHLPKFSIPQPSISPPIVSTFKALRGHLDRGLAQTSIAIQYSNPAEI